MICILLLIDNFDNIPNNAVKYNNNENKVKDDIKLSKIQQQNIEFIKLEFINYEIGVSDERKEILFETTYSNKISV